MRQNRVLLLTVVAVLVGDLPAVAQALPTSSLSRLAPAVRDEVDRLVSDDAGRRATAAASLGDMGAAALDALPWLVARTHVPS